MRAHAHTRLSLPVGGGWCATTTWYSTRCLPHLEPLPEDARVHTMGERKQRQHEECAAAHHLCQRQRWAAVRPGQGEGEGRGAGATRGASVRTYGLRGQRSLPWGRLQCRKSTLGGARAPCPPALPAWRLHVRAAPWRRLSHAGGRACRGREEGAAARLLSRKVGREAARTYHAAPQVASGPSSFASGAAQ